MRFQPIARHTAWLVCRPHLPHRGSRPWWVGAWRGLMAGVPDAVASARRLFAIRGILTAEYALVHRLEL